MFMFALVFSLFFLGCAHILLMQRPGVILFNEILSIIFYLKNETPYPSWDYPVKEEKTP